MTQYEPTVDRCRQCGGWLHMDNECVTCIIRINRQGSHANEHRMFSNYEKERGA